MAKNAQSNFRRAMTRRFAFQHAGPLWLVCAISAGYTFPIRAQDTTEIVLHSFAAPPRGALPYSGVIRDSAGNLYGTTSAGGPFNAGVVYRVDSQGHQHVLYNFTGGPDGGTPYGGLIADSGGNLYGTTFNGGTGGGVVYKIDTAGHETVLHSFSGEDGVAPYSGVIRDAAGNLYGTTYYGGPLGFGVVYKLDTAGHETVLYNFKSGSDGSQPTSGVVRDAAGRLYGTTPYGGASSAGVVYRLDPGGHEEVLYSFSAAADGGYPQAGVIRDADGNLYGTAPYCGAANQGVVYKLDSTGAYTLLYTFTGGTDGGDPSAGVIRDSAGNLYGTVVNGGASNAGAVYKLDPSGNESVLYSFEVGDGYAPFAGVIRDAKGNFYGTTYWGGTMNQGVVYKLDKSGHESVMYSFPIATDGAFPDAGVFRDSAGNLYGTTSSGGTADAGTVYKVDPSGHETVLYNFSGGTDGGYPIAGVICDSAGNLYGTVSGGGKGFGAVYKLDASGNFAVLYSFTGGSDGAYPLVGVIRDAAGSLFGTTESGGKTGEGVVYKLDTSGHLTTLHSFSGSDGCQPNAVIRDSAGNFYGTTAYCGAGSNGVIYKLDKAGHATVLYNFTGGADGAQPRAGVVRDAEGNLYGTTAYGGATGVGTVYKLDTAGNETVLYSFTFGNGGQQPYTAGVVLDAEGNLYGTGAWGGATGGGGVVYKLDQAGNQTILHSFTFGADGATPYGGVIRDSAGNLYGTTSGGGKSRGVVFKLKLQ